MNCTKPKKYNISNNGDGKEMEIERIFDKKEDNGKVKKTRNKYDHNNHINNINNHNKNKKIESEESENECGSLDDGDKVKKIIKEKLDAEGKLLLEVQWEKRSNGSVPNNSLVPSYIIKKKYPQLVAEYLEQRLIEMELINFIATKPIKNPNNIDSSMDDNSIDENEHIRKKKRFESIVSIDSEFADDSP